MIFNENFSVQSDNETTGTARIIKIIIVDDEKDVTDYLKSELHAYDEQFEVTAYNVGYDALRAIRENRFDLLITDIAMPDMDGYELYTKVKDEKPELPIIMMTGFGYDPTHIVVNTKKAGLKDVIFKPFDMNRLVALIYRRLQGE